MSNHCTHDPNYFQWISKFTTSIVIPLGMFMLLASIYFGYKILIKFSGKIFSEKKLDPIIDPILQVDIQIYAYFQYEFFYWAVFLILMCFVLMSVMTICKAEIFRRTVFAFYFLFILIFVMTLPVKFYTNYTELGKSIKGFKEQITKRQDSSENTGENEIYNDKVLKELINTTKENTEVQVHRELINTTRKMTELLFNWAVLLLTGLGYLVARNLKLLH